MEHVVTLLWWQAFIRGYFLPHPCTPEITMIIKDITLNWDVITGLESEKDAADKNHLYVGPNPALIEGHSRMASVSLTWNDFGRLRHFRGRHSPKLRAPCFFMPHGITSCLPLCLFNNKVLTLRNKLCLKATAVETQLCLFSFSS